MAVVEEVRPAVPDVVEVDAVQTGEGIPMDCDDDGDMRDSGRNACVLWW